VILIGFSGTVARPGANGKVRTAPETVTKFPTRATSDTIGSMKMTVALVACGMLALRAAASCFAGQDHGTQDHKTWMDYGGGPDSSHFVALTQIDRSNVGRLRIAWIYPAGDDRSYLFNPIVVGNLLYVLARNSSLVALNAQTGKEIWIHENLPGLSTRGIAFWQSKDRKDRRLIFAINNYLEEIDANTGKSILTFGARGLVNLKEGLGRDPRTVSRIQSDTPGRVFEDLIIMGSSTGEAYLSPPGDIRAYKVITGKMAWSFHTIPHPGELGYDTWPRDAWKYSGGTNTWGEMSVDEKRGIVYLPTGSPTYDYYGADRIGANLFANCLVALDAHTGKRLWHFQMVHHDLWDYDATAAPQLLTIRHNGKPLDVVAESSKQGFLYVFDRVTGKPVWPIEERSVPNSEMPGEQAWPTQPFPTAPPPFARQKITADDVNPYILTSEERAAWKDRIAAMRNEGLFTPPGVTETISLPGARGGSNWGTGAANPSRGLMYLTTQDWPTIYKLSTTDPLGRRNSADEPETTTYEARCQGCHGANGMRAGAGPPALAGISSRLSLDSFRLTVHSGRGEMPAFADLDDSAIQRLYAYLGRLRGPESIQPVVPASNGAVVALGGAPGGLDIAPSAGARYTPLGGPPYPEGSDTPHERYYTNWGLYPDQPYIINPPWSSVVAYDLTTGTIKWKVPLGLDAKAAAQGAHDTGAFMAEHHGMIVTSTGLIFVSASDGKLRALDEETGKVLWSVQLPFGAEGIPCMYEAGGRQFLVLAATSDRGAERNPTSQQPRGYAAFTLP
jgi:quinoprotein glucose dehydrogenase